jgi:hypothetical protein
MGREQLKDKAKEMQNGRNTPNQAALAVPYFLAKTGWKKPGLPLARRG